MARLVVLSEEFAGRSYELKVDRTTVGRVDDNAFQIPEGSVSSHHCEILLRGNDVVIHDLNSTNGTFINGQQITGEAVLKPGQTLRLGQIEMRLENGEPPGTPPAPSPAKSVAKGPTGSESKPAPAKKVPDHTMVIPQGVKLGGDHGERPSFGPGTAFEKKTNRGTKIFIGATIVLGVVIIAIIIITALRVR